MLQREFGFSPFLAPPPKHHDFWSQCDLFRELMAKTKNLAWIEHSFFLEVASKSWICQLLQWSMLKNLSAVFFSKIILSWWWWMIYDDQSYEDDVKGAGTSNSAGLFLAQWFSIKLCGWGTPQFSWRKISLKKQVSLVKNAYFARNVHGPKGFFWQNDFPLRGYGGPKMTLIPSLGQNWSFWQAKLLVPPYRGTNKTNGQWQW